MENNKQQTPVDWLVEKMLTQDWYTYKSLEYIKQAKEIEKERMIQFAQSYAVIHCMGDITKNADEFYKETYGDYKK